MRVMFHADILEKTSDDVWIRKGEYKVRREVPKHGPNSYLIEYKTKLILVDLDNHPYIVEVIGGRND